MRLRRLPVVFALVLSLAGFAAPATAGPPGKWTVISGGGLSNIVEPGMYRTADGTLHVALVRDNPNSTESIDVAHISESGKLLGRTTVIDQWATVTKDPELVGSPSGGMRLVFGGLRTTVTGDPYNEGYAYWAESDPSGTLWTLAPNTTPANAGTTGYASYGTGVATLADGTLVTAYPLNTTIYYQVGVGTAMQSFEVGDCCAYDMTLAQDNGVVWAAWSANGDTDSTRGIFVRQIYPTLGATLKAPKSSTNDGYLQLAQGVAMTVRSGGGTYLTYCTGYPFCDTMVLWKIGTSGTTKVPGSKNAVQVAISDAPSGRLWIAWATDGDEVYAIRTDTKANGFGALRHLPPPKKSLGVYDLGVEGSRARADIVFNDSESIWHQQVFAGLTLKASPGQWNGDHSEKVEFKVTDAGDGVQGAKVKAKWDGNKLSCKTDANGKCSITFPKMGKNKIAVTAKKSGYAPDESKLKVN
jgi:hypothetical protein